MRDSHRVVEGRDFMRMAVAACCVAAAVGAGCAGEESGESAADVPAVKTERPAVTFAPLLRLHARERWWPLAADEFIGYSTFNWSNAPCFNADVTLAIGGPRRRLRMDEPEPIVDPRRLGGRMAAPYRARPLRADCVRGRPVRYASDDAVAPYARRRAAGLRPGEGFFLDLLTDKLDGDPEIDRASTPPRLAGVPVYFARRRVTEGGRPAVRIDYWTLYGLEFPLPESAGDYVEHEGDWERVSVLLRPGARPGRYRPLALELVAAGRVRRVPWTDVELDRSAGDGIGHPVVYVARGSHGAYPSPGVRGWRRDYRGRTLRFEDESSPCPACVEWPAWRSLRPLHAEPWYGYGGGWGVIGRDRWTTGPGGPA